MGEPGVGRTKAGNRSFTLEYKLAFLREWDAAVGEVGARSRMLRERNLSRSTVGRWLDARKKGQFTESMVKSATSANSSKRLSEMRAEAAAWKARAEAAEAKAAQAEAAQEILGKAFELLEGINNSTTPEPQIPPALLSAEEYKQYLQRLHLS